jgi:thioredoxin reductase
MRESDLIIIGGGPAGLGAAVEAAKSGVKDITVFDENAKVGGQLVKQLHKFFGSYEHQAGVRGFELGKNLEAEAIELGVKIKTGCPVWGIFRDNKVGVYTAEGKIQQWQYKKCIIATGAVENSLAFPGWTLPGVMGAGACQTMMNQHRVMPGSKVLMVGSGNVGLIVSYQLLQAGAESVTIIEAAPKIGGYGVHASKVVRAGVKILTSHTVDHVEGTDEEGVKKAVICKLDEKWQKIPGTESSLDVDMVCLAVGLSPLTELARMAECETAYVPVLGGYLPIHDENMKTTVDDIYVAGDIAGVEEASTALDEGRLAGVAVAGALGAPDKRKMNAEIKKIKARLLSLRTGSHGAARQAGKEQVWERM